MPQHSLCSIRLLINSKYRVSFLAPLASRWCTPACQVAQSCLTLCHPVGCSRQAPLSMGFSRQEHWSGVPCLPSGDLPNPGIKPVSPISPAVDSLLSEPLGKPKLMVENLNQVFKRNSVMSLLLFLCSLYNFLSQIHTFFFHFISPLMACLNHDLSHSP